MKPLTRRAVLATSAASMVARASAATPFDPAQVRAMARDLARAAYRPPPEAPAGGLTYDQYRAIRYRPERALWRDGGSSFQIQFFPCGLFYHHAVTINEVVDGRAAPVAFDAGLFETDDASVRIPADLGFAGFRAHVALERPDTSDEFCVFLGASYFRARGRGLEYGLSARGLALGTGLPTPEEFPEFREFWLERPAPGSEILVVHALLDSPSASGAFRFVLRPGETTVTDVECTLFPRVDINEVGMAPLTSMYYFADADHGRRPDDWRTAVHDSDGLAILTGRGESIWRPLANPADVGFSTFSDTSPRGFGLMQRRRGFEAYGDLTVLYDKRPSCWVEPVGDWGPGAVALVEIPSESEYNDNIVAFWRGHDPLRRGQEVAFAYRLRWGVAVADATGLARVSIVRSGAGTQVGTRVFVLDLDGAQRPADARVSVELASSTGVARTSYVGPNPATGGWRISIDFDPQGAGSAELRCRLMGEAGPLSETWLHRWMA